MLLFAATIHVTPFNLDPFFLDNNLPLNKHYFLFYLFSVNTCLYFFNPDFRVYISLRVKFQVVTFGGSSVPFIFFTIQNLKSFKLNCPSSLMETFIYFFLPIRPLVTVCLVYFLLYVEEQFLVTCTCFVLVVLLTLFCTCVYCLE